MRTTMKSSPSGSVAFFPIAFSPLTINVSSSLVSYSRSTATGGRLKSLMETIKLTLTKSDFVSVAEMATIRDVSFLTFTGIRASVSFKVTLSRAVKFFINGADVSTTNRSLSLSSSANSFARGILNVSASDIVSRTTAPVSYGARTVVGWFSAGGGSTGQLVSPGQTRTSPSFLILILNWALAEFTVPVAKTTSDKLVSFSIPVGTKTSVSFNVAAAAGLTLVNKVPAPIVIMVTTSSSLATKTFERTIFKESLFVMESCTTLS